MLILPFVDVWIYITHAQNQIHIKSHACTTLKSCVWTGITTSLANFSIKKKVKHTYSETNFFLLLEVLSGFFFVYLNAG